MSDTQIQIYLELSLELQQLISDNNLSVDEILRQQNVDAKVTYGLHPDEPEVGIRSKDPALIIVASAAAALAVGAAISQVLRTMQRQPQLVEYFELVELRDAQGNVLLNKKGKPQFKRVKKYELLEPRKQDSNQYLEIVLNALNGMVLKFSSAEKQTKTEDKPKST